MHPKLSIVMPAYNHQQLVGEAIESVLTQTFGDFEFIIIDDGSTDNTADVISSYKDERIQYHYQQNQDAYNAINNGMAKARGELIAILNSDDVYLPNRFERMLAFQEKRDQAGALLLALRARAGYRSVCTIPLLESLS